MTETTGGTRGIFGIGYVSPMLAGMRIRITRKDEFDPPLKDNEYIIKDAHTIIVGSVALFERILDATALR